MTADDPNIHLVEILVSHLGDLREEFVFVGGCATGLLITDTAGPVVRATKDVDVITEVATKGDYYALAERLREKGFTEDPSEGVICRWNVGGIQVDVMPTDEEILGFSNQWYQAAIDTAEERSLPSGECILVVSPPVFLATKLEAFYGRGQGDFGVSHDIEDIVTLIDGRPEIIAEVLNATEEIKGYLQEEFDSLLSDQDFVNSINWHLQGDSDSQGRSTTVIERLRAIAGL